MGTPTTADAVSCDPTAITSTADVAPTSDATSSRSELIRDPGSTKEEQRARQAQLVDQGRIPVPSTDVEQAGGGGVGALDHLFTGEPESQQIGDHQHPGGVIDDSGFMIDS